MFQIDILDKFDINSMIGNTSSHPIEKWGIPKTLKRLLFSIENEFDPEMFLISIISTGIGGMVKTGKIAFEGTSYVIGVYGTRRSFMEDKKENSEC